jgi:chorismate mutase
MSIEQLRLSLDEIDLQINSLLSQRFFVCTAIAIEKKKNGLPIIDETAKMARKTLYAKTLGVYGEAIYDTIHEQSVKIQKEI